MSHWIPLFLEILRRVDTHIIFKLFAFPFTLEVEVVLTEIGPLVSVVAPLLIIPEIGGRVQTVLNAFYFDLVTDHGVGTIQEIGVGSSGLVPASLLFEVKFQTPGLIQQILKRVLSEQSAVDDPNRLQCHFRNPVDFKQDVLLEKVLDEDSLLLTELTLVLFRVEIKRDQRFYLGLTQTWELEAKVVIFGDSLVLLTVPYFLQGLHYIIF
jgi:hypothetical protein